MPGYLLHFCAEWQKARKVLPLDPEAVFDLTHCIVDEAGELASDSILVQQLGLEGWRLDVAAATESGILRPHTSGQEDDNMCYTVGPNLIQRNPTVGSLLAHSKTGHLSPRSQNLKVQPQLQPQLSHNKTNQVSKANLGPAITKNVSEHIYATKDNAPPVMRQMVLFRNPSHPLSGMASELCKDEFVAEVRKRLIAEPLFPQGRQHQDNLPAPVMAVEDAEDLFEALMLLQGRPDGATVPLLVGRQLDEACDKFFVLSRLRQLMEKGATSLPAFF
jgi:hypothetical protein